MTQRSTCTTQDQNSDEYMYQLRSEFSEYIYYRRSRFRGVHVLPNQNSEEYMYVEYSIIESILIWEYGILMRPISNQLALSRLMLTFLIELKRAAKKTKKNKTKQFTNKKKIGLYPKIWRKSKMGNLKFWQNCRIYSNVWTSGKLVCTIVVCCFLCILDNV